MRYYKIIENGYIAAIGTGAGGQAITQEAYEEILAAIRNKPVAEGFDHHIVDGSLDYVAFALPPVADTGEIPASVALDIITGGADHDAQ